MIELYDDPAQMEPLVIDPSRPVHGSLIGLAHELSEASARLDAALAPATAGTLADLVAGMNCYYSNLIEGHHTRPFEIEQALQAVSRHAEQAALQSLALAHIATDRWVRGQSLSQDSLLQFLVETHRRFCAKLPPEMLRLADGSLMEPGQIRRREVSVGQHVAPKHQTLHRFLERYWAVYGRHLAGAGKGGFGKLDGIVAAFCAHHRLAWIHPFLDGNGRVARLALDAMLRQCGVNGASLWSMSRGFAKSASEYKARLAAADQPRMGDLDGRGNLSEARLAEFCTYAIQTAVDQATFMGGMFALGSFRSRAEGYFWRVRHDLKPESLHLFLHAFTMGEFERMEAGRLTGLPERTARNVLRDLLAEGLLYSDSPKGKVRVGFPVHVLGSLLPNLYPAGDVDLDQQALQRKVRAVRDDYMAWQNRRGG